MSIHALFLFLSLVPPASLSPFVACGFKTLGSRCTSSITFRDIGLGTSLVRIDEPDLDDLVGEFLGAVYLFVVMKRHIACINCYCTHLVNALHRDQVDMAWKVANITLVRTLP